MRQIWVTLVGVGALITIAMTIGISQTASKFKSTSELGTWEFPNRERVNDGTVTIMTGPVGGLTPIMGADLARVLDDGDRLRVLPVGGKGSVQNIIDILSLKSIDMGMVVSDVAEFFRIQYNVPNIESRLRFIAKLYNNEIYVVAPNSIKSIYDLAGKKVMAPKDVGFFSARIIFSRLNIDAHFDYQTDDTLSLQRVIDGQADAWIVSVGKIFPIARSIKNENGKLHLVPIPYDPKLRDLYLPSRLTSEEYPNLIPASQEVETLATSVILASFNWPENTDRYRKVARFVDAFFSKINEFYVPPRNPKWRETNIQASALGWQRFKAAQDWLDNRFTVPSRLSPEEIKQFLAEKGISRGKNFSQEDITRLFNAFTEWAKSRR